MRMAGDSLAVTSDELYAAAINSTVHDMAAAATMDSADERSCCEIDRRHMAVYYLKAPGQERERKKERKLFDRRLCAYVSSRIELAAFAHHSPIL
jgi:hypothetical protein